VLNSTLNAEAFQTTNSLRSLVFELLPGLRKICSVGLVAAFLEFAESVDGDGCVGFQFRFKLIALRATAFEAVAELEGAGVVVAGVFVRGAVGADAGWHGGC